MWHEIIKIGKLDFLKLITPFNPEESKLMLMAQDEKGYTCLHVAAEKGKVSDCF